ncbi:O-antigen ligase family protein [Mariniflexile sp. HNIBRBA6329]|uniref:O-antigen ligase family protein n=1 Tax=Mariniflexile sp. HNIBRBA6329 TaxID=3373088 RepID=UPI003746B4CE
MFTRIKINESDLNKTQIVLLSISMVGLLLPINISSFLLIVFVVFSIIKQIFYHKTAKSFNLIALLFSGFYLFYVASLFYSNNIHIAFRLLERNISWFILPVIFSLGIHSTKEERFKTLIPFAIATQLFALFFLVVALFNFLQTGKAENFYYTELTSILDFHPVYFSLYLLFSLSIFVYGYFEKQKNIPVSLMIGLFLFDILMLILLSSKNILFVSILIFLITLIKNYKNQKWLLVLFSLSILFLLRFTTTKERIQESLFSKWELLSKDKFLYNDPFTGATLRLITWKFVLLEMKNNNYLIGTGSGDSQELIDDVYKKHKMDDAGYLGLNMHNQFLEFFVSFGVIGLLYFLIILFVCFKKAIKQNDYLYLIFLFSFSFMSLTESNLKLHRGIVFFVLLNSLMYFSKYKKV